MQLLKFIMRFFNAEKIEYWHRDRSIEVIAQENGLDIDTIKEETITSIKSEGRIEAITKLKHRFHIPLSAAWRFVNKLDN